MKQKFWKSTGNLFKTLYFFHEIIYNNNAVKYRIYLQAKSIGKKCLKVFFAGEN